ncbi:sterile alpha motif domain-containing protein 9 [Biomphalaria glabrata]|nr:sterile alpha motif domain-containing protein 9 [Biomphalaria glabrata]
MNAPNWEKLRKNWGQLMELHPEYILPKLFEKEVLTQNDIENIKSYTSREGQMKSLLMTLKSMPAYVNAFGVFLTVLKTDHLWLVDMITETSTSSDASISAAVNPDILDEEAKSVLQTYFHSQKRSQTLLLDIRNCLKQNHVFKDYCQWNNRKLIHFIEEEFAGVSYDKHKRMFMNLEKNNLDELISKSSSSIGNGHLSVGDNNKEKKACVKINGPVQNEHVQTGNSKSKSKLSRLYSDPSSQSNKNSISVNRQHSWPTKLPPTNTSTFKKRRKSKNSQNKFKVNSDSKIPSTELLPFGSSTNLSLTYIQGQRLKLICNKTCKLTPVKNFHMVPKNVEISQVYLYIALEIIKFASACLNDCQNGTVYFGVDTDRKDHDTLAEIVGVQVSKNDLVKTIDFFKHHAFAAKVREAVIEALHEPRLVPVDNREGQRTGLFVIEVDVAPHSAVVGDSIFRVKSFPQHTRKQNASLYTFNKFGLPEPIQLHKFRKLHSSHTEARQREEKEMISSSSALSMKCWIRRILILLMVISLLLSLPFVSFIFYGNLTKNPLHNLCSHLSNINKEKLWTTYVP